MINFLVRHKDEIILLVIGVMIGGTMNVFAKIIKKGFLILWQQIKIGFKFIIRRIKGEYNLAELIELLEKSPEKLSKRESKAIEKYNKEMSEANQICRTLITIKGVKH